LTFFREHRFFRFVCIAEGLVLLWILFQCLRPSCDLSFSADTLTPSASGSSSYTIELGTEENSSSYEISSKRTMTATTVLESEYFTLNPGAYTVTVYYQSDTGSDERDSFDNSTGSLSLNSRRHGSFFYFDSLDLRDSYTEESSTVQISSPVALNDMSLSVDFSGGGTLSIESIQITEISAYNYALLVIFLLAFFALDWALIQFIRGKWGMTEGILCLICLAAAIPFIADFSYSGHDYDFHLNRIVCLADEFRQGNYFPAIFSTALNGYGYANPLFYGQIFLYIPAFLYCVGFPLSVAYNIYIILFSIAACLIMYLTSLRIFRRKRAALFAAALYTLSAVRLTNIFTRSAVGEFTAQTFLPLVVLGFYNIYTAKKNEKITLKKYLPIVIGLTGIVLSHILTIMMCALLILGFCLCNLRKTLEPNRFAALWKAAFLTVLVNLATLVPFVDSYSMELIVNNIINYIQASGTYPVQLFNVIVDNFQADSIAGTAANEMSLTIGFSITFGLGLFAFIWIRTRRKRAPGEDPSEFRFVRICFILACITLFLSSRLMPYDALDFLPYFIYSFLTAYQFSWRWLVFATLFGVYCTAYAADRIGDVAVNKLTPQIIPLAIIAILSLNTGQIYADQLRTGTLEKYSNNSYEYNFCIGAGEYLLYDPDSMGYTISLTDILDEYHYSDVTVETGEAEVSDYTRTGSGAVFTVTNDSEEAAEVLLPIQCYDNYYAYDESGNSLLISRGDYNKISVSVPAGYTGQVTVSYHFPYSWRAAIAVSAASIVLTAAYGVYRSRKKKRSRRFSETNNVKE
jgi:hypothetical protein